MDKIVEKRRLREKEKNGKYGLKTFNVTLVTMEELDSSDVTLGNLNDSTVTLENLESSNVTLVSEDKDIIGANLTSVYVVGERLIIWYYIWRLRKRRRMEILDWNLLMLL